MKKRPDLTEVTRDNFMQAFCEMYANRPLEKITVKELSETAGYSRVTFYNYFTDPYDLLEKLEEDLIAKIINAIMHNVASGDLIGGFVESFTALDEECERISSLLLLGSYAEHFISKFKKTAVPMLLRTFNINADNEQAAYVLEFYIAGVLSIFSKWIRDGKQIPVDKLAELIKSILANGVLSTIDLH